MKKRINLYTSVKKRSPFDPLGFHSSLIIFASVVVGVVLLSAVLNVYAQSQENRLSELQQRRATQDKAIAEAEARLKNRQVDAEITAEQQRLRAKIASHKQILQFFSRIEPVQSYGFAEYLLALAERSRPESWLTNFTLDAEQNIFLIQGAAIDGPSVPLMLESLGQSRAFRGISVGSLSVEATASGVQFQVDAELPRYE